MGDILFIVVPAYNESENIRQLVSDWYPVVERHSAGQKSRLVIVNDGSRDDTYEILQELAVERPLLQPLTKPNGGHGSAVLFAYRYAVDQRADYIFQTDSDGQTDPAEFEAFWEQREFFDAIFGNRTKRGDGQNRAFVEKVLCLILKHYFRVSVPDSNAPFRLMTRAYLEEFLPLMPENYNLPNVMLTTFGVRFHKRVKFIPITFGPRQGGKNSMNVKKIVKIGWQARKDFRMFRKYTG
ncbi:glycosyltransferase family 2 protein [Bilifractor sp. LCP21S3_A7]|jgi:glycosyltransferase involved in cell wall biosynthesis|uniref:glycosyltransferase family 2 protein n=1 Tax=Bilifractor sp. LCP21S3_A7 TaxID=3438738 RepID=UPI003F9148DB